MLSLADDVYTRCWRLMTDAVQADSYRNAFEQAAGGSGAAKQVPDDEPRGGAVNEG